MSNLRYHEHGLEHDDAEKSSDACPEGDEEIANVMLRRLSVSQESRDWSGKPVGEIGRDERV